MGCCGKRIRPFPAPPESSGATAPAGAVLISVGPDLFSELVLTAAVRDTPSMQFVIAGGTPEIWGHFVNARSVPDFGADPAIPWNPMSPGMVLAGGQNIFQVAGDRFREAGMPLVPGPMTCHLPVAPDLATGVADGVLIDASIGVPGGIGLPGDLVDRLLSAIPGSRVFHGGSYGDMVAAAIGARVVVCPPGPMHLVSCGAFRAGSHGHRDRATVLLPGGAWPSWALPGYRQVVIESWWGVGCSGGGCGALLCGDGPSSSDRCRAGVPTCFGGIDAGHVAAVVSGLVSGGA